MKTRWKKAAALGMAALMMTGAAAGCQKKESAPDGTEKIVLNVWHQWTDPNSSLTQTFQTAVEDYEKEHENIDIELHGLDTDSYKTKMSTEFAGNAKGVDVFYYWAPGKLKQLVNADKVLAVDEYLPDGVLDRVKEGSTRSFELGDSLYGLPIDSYMMILYCNTDLFAQAGAEIPTDYEGLLEAGEKLAQLDGVTPLAVGAKDGWLAAALYEAVALREVGADAVNQILLGEQEFTDAGLQEAARKVVELYDKGVLGKNPLEDGEAEANADFLNEKAAMTLNGSWFAGTIDTDPDSAVKEHVTAVTFPLTSADGNAKDFAGGANSSFFVNKNTEYPQESAEFAAYIAEQMGSRATELGTGFSSWNVETDAADITPTFVPMIDLFNSVENGVLNWDSTLDANAASVHLEQSQSLLSGSADLEAFMKAHQEALASE